MTRRAPQILSLALALIGFLAGAAAFLLMMAFLF